jgi:hypothetical protein
MANIDHVTPWGVFDSQTLVDVFLMYLTKRGAKKAPIPGGLTVTELGPGRAELAARGRARGRLGPQTAAAPAAVKR